jgi:hypothetical protein
MPLCLILVGRVALKEDAAVALQAYRLPFSIDPDLCCVSIKLSVFGFDPAPELFDLCAG